MNLSMSIMVMTKIRAITWLLTMIAFRHSLVFKNQLYYLHVETYVQNCYKLCMWTTDYCKCSSYIMHDRVANHYLELSTGKWWIFISLHTYKNYNLFSGWDTPSCMWYLPPMEIPFQIPRSNIFSVSILSHFLL